MKGWSALPRTGGPPPPLEGAIRIGVVRPLSLPEALLAEPAFTSLRSCLRRAHLTLLGSEAAELAELIPVFDEAWEPGKPGENLEAPSPSPGAGAAGIADFLDRLHSGAQDVLLVFRGPGESPHGWAYLGHLAGVPYRVGASAEFGGKTLTTHVPPPPPICHSVARHLALVQAMGLSAESRSPRFQVPGQATVSMARALEARRAAGGFCLIDSALRTVVEDGKENPQAWQALLEGSRRIVSRAADPPANPSVIIAGESSGEPVASPAGCVGLTPSSLPLLAALVSRAALVMATDGPILQLAAALGRPLVGLFADRWAAAQRRPLREPPEVTVIVPEEGRSPSADDLLAAAAFIQL